MNVGNVQFAFHGEHIRQICMRYGREEKGDFCPTSHSTRQKTAILRRPLQPTGHQTTGTNLKRIFFCGPVLHPIK